MTFLIIFLTSLLEIGSVIFSNISLVLLARHAGSDGSMSASGSAGPGFEPRRGSKLSFENFQPRG